MTRTLAPIYSTAWRMAAILLTAEIAFVSVQRYLTGGEAPPPPILANAFASPFLTLHVVGGVTALVLMPLQFVRRIRTGWPAFHRAIGQVSVLACVIGAPAGLMLALGTTAGPIARVGFAIPALLWALFTWLGWRAAVARRFDAHREWMLRSYAVVSTAITLRLMLPAAGLLSVEFYPAYRVIAWLSWMTNLVLFEIYIRRSRRVSRPVAAALAAG